MDIFSNHKELFYRLIPAVIIFVALWVVLIIPQFSMISNSLPTAIRISETFSIPLYNWVVALFGALLFMLFRKKDKNRDFSQKGKEYGSAKWGKKADAAPFMDKNPYNNIVLTNTEGLTMNSRPKPVKYARNKNILVVGGSGTGKTRFYMKPNIMQAAMCSLYPQSLVITDPKGTILEEVGHMLVSKGYQIKTINTVNFKRSMHYNPFAYIKSEKDILSLVTALMANTSDPEKKGGDDFWGKAEQLLYQALISFIHSFLPPEDRNLNTLVDLINQMETKEEDEDFKNPVDMIFDAIQKGSDNCHIPLYDKDGNQKLDKNGEPITKTLTEMGHYFPKKPDHFCVRQYTKYKLAAGKTAKSILISCAARLGPFDIAEIRKLVSKDEMELDKLGGYKNEKGEIIKQKIALFVIVSDTDTTYNFLVGLMYSQMFNLLCTIADNEFDGRLPIHVRCLLDEFANIGQIPQFDKLIATIRSREISATIVLQTYTQLKTIYKDSSDTIIGNCDTKLFLGGGEKTTLKEWSEALGKATIDMSNESENLGAKGGGGSRSHQKLGRELLTVDELGLLDGGNCLMQIRGARPFLSQKYDIERHVLYKQLKDYNNRTFRIKSYLKKQEKLAFEKQKKREEKSIKKSKKQGVGQSFMINFA